MENKLITVITASYNAADTIERSILSIINQKADDIAYIIIDGNSKDDTMKIVERYRDRIDYAISEPDKGVYDAWNKGLTAAHGQWIVFLGADDFYEPDTFKKYRDFINSHDVTDIDIISAKCRLINAQGKELRILGQKYEWRKFRHGINCVAHGTTLHNAKLFKELGNYDIRFNINADFEFLLRRPMKALFIDSIILDMQYGGLSYSAKGIIQSYQVKKYRNSADCFHDNYYLLKGLTGFYLRKLIWKITKRSETHTS